MREGLSGRTPHGTIQTSSAMRACTISHAHFRCPSVIGSKEPPSTATVPVRDEESVRTPGTPRPLALRMSMVKFANASGGAVGSSASPSAAPLASEELALPIQRPERNLREWSGRV